MGIYKVVFATGSRADYGIVRNYLFKLNNSPEVDLSILVTGALLSEKYGHQIELIKKDGFRIESEIDIDLNSSTNADVIHSMAIALDGFGDYFEKHKYDLLIILGDRFEMMSVAIAAAMQRISILHIHGGEATFGNYDEFIRHCITKMSRYHFTATEEYRKRVIQLGENPDTVYNLGALGAENCKVIDEDLVPAEIKNIERKTYFVVLFHPETLTGISVTEQTSQVLNALEQNGGNSYVFLGSNADTHSDEIRRLVLKFVDIHDNTLYFENLPTAGYHFLLKNSLGLIGNSSSGLIEAPSFGVMTINIGDRQAGRIRGNSVIDVPCFSEAISDAIRTITKDEMDLPIINPYYRENSAESYYKQTLKILYKIKAEKLSPKVFYNIEYEFS